MTAAWADQYKYAPTFSTLAMGGKFYRPRNPTAGQEGVGVNLLKDMPYEAY